MLSKKFDLSSDKLLKVFTLTNNQNLREALFAEYKEKGYAHHTMNLLVTADKLKRIMQDYQFDYEQALIFLKLPQAQRLALITWCMQGNQLGQENHPYHIPIYVSLAIADFLLKLPKENISIFHANIRFTMHKKLVVNELEKKVARDFTPPRFFGLFAKPARYEQCKQAQQRLRLFKSAANQKTLETLLTAPFEPDNFYPKTRARHYQRLKS